VIEDNDDMIGQMKKVVKSASILNP